jgi:hypothetical protein
MMSIDYKGKLKTGYLTHLTNRHNMRKYAVYTVPRATGRWETVVFQRTPVAASRPPLASANTWAESEAAWLHDQVETIAEQRNPTEWRVAVLNSVKGSDDHVYHRQLLDNTETINP